MLLRPVPSLLDGLTLQVDQCLERGDQAGAAMFIDLIYDLHDWATLCDMAGHIGGGTRELLVVGAD